MSAAPQRQLPLPVSAAPSAGAERVAPPALRAVALTTPAPAMESPARLLHAELERRLAHAFDSAPPRAESLPERAVRLASIATGYGALALGAALMIRCFV